VSSRFRVAHATHSHSLPGRSQRIVVWCGAMRISATGCRPVAHTPLLGTIRPDHRPHLRFRVAAMSLITIGAINFNGSGWLSLLLLAILLLRTGRPRLAARTPPRSAPPCAPAISENIPLKPARPVPIPVEVRPAIGHSKPPRHRTAAGETAEPVRADKPKYPGRRNSNKVVGQSVESYSQPRATRAKRR
jgi:hypothetical protein